MQSPNFRPVSLTTPKTLLLVVMVAISGTVVAAYRSSYRRYGRSFLNKNAYSRPSYYTPKARYTHYGFNNYQAHPHPHPHPQNTPAVGVPVPITLNGDNFINDIEAISRLMPFGFQDSYLIPLEAVLSDIAAKTGYKSTKLSQLIRKIKHDIYIGANGADPLLHAILKQYGFVYTGTGLGYGQMGATVPQNEVNDIFQSLGLGGATGNAYNNGLGVGAATGITSAQGSIPGATGDITDDLFDDFDNSLLGLMGEGTAATARLSDEPQLMSDDNEADQMPSSDGSDVTPASTSDVLGL